MRRNEKKQITYQITMFSEINPERSLILQFDAPGILSVFRSELFYQTYRIFKHIEKHVSFFVEELHDETQSYTRNTHYFLFIHQNCRRHTSEKGEKKMSEEEREAIYQAMKLIILAMDRLASVSKESLDRLFNEVISNDNETEKK